MPAQNSAVREKSGKFPSVIYNMVPHILRESQKKISFWAYNLRYDYNKITRSLKLVLLTKNTMLLFCLTIYSTLLAKRHHQSKIIYFHVKTDILQVKELK